MFTGHCMEMKELAHLKTAILLFANSPEEEMKQKSLVNAEKLYSELTAHTLKVIRDTNLPFFHFSEQKQRGQNFGERFYNAISDVFLLGYDKIITLGNDTPQISSASLLGAAKILDKGKLVLGPSIDGGFYLMGIHRSQFEALNFQELPWQTSSLNAALVSEIKAKSWEIERLEVLSDIDELEDVLQIINRNTTIPSFLLEYYLLVFGIKRPIQDVIPGYTYLSATLSFYNKGSPSLADYLIA